MSCEKSVSCLCGRQPLGEPDVVDDVRWNSTLTTKQQLSYNVRYESEKKKIAFVNHSLEFYRFN